MYPFFEQERHMSGKNELRICNSSPSSYTIYDPRNPFHHNDDKPQALFLMHSEHTFLERCSAVVQILHHTINLARVAPNPCRRASQCGQVAARASLLMSPHTLQMRPAPLHGLQTPSLFNSRISPQTTQLFLRAFAFAWYKRGCFSL